MPVPWNKIARAPYPNVGFRAQVKAGKKNVVLDESSSCREEIIYSTKNGLQEAGYRRSQYSGERAWFHSHMTKKPKSKLNLDAPGSKQPSLTFLYAFVDLEEDDGAGFACKRPCCTEPMRALLDALVGPACVLLDPDRYVGDWWQTSPDEFLSTSKKHYRYGSEGTVYKWYGSSNFFLRHPALLSIVLGLFRQTFMITNVDAEGDLLKKINRKEVEDCLTSADPELAMRLVTQARPWLESSENGTFFPFSNKNFRLLIDLHRAIYKHGYDEVFGETFDESWDLEGISTGIDHGAFSYFGTKSKESTNRKRVAKLAKK